MRRLLVVLLALATCAALLQAASQPKAALGIDGLGWWRDHAMRGTLLVLLGNERGVTIGAEGIEDAALVLYASLRQQGYLDPEIRVRVTEGAARPKTFTLDQNLEHPLPRNLAATQVMFLVKKGPRYEVGVVTFAGLSAIPADKARTYFRGDGVLASFTSEKAYSPDGLRRSEANLLNELHRLGYAEAEVKAQPPQVDARTHVAQIAVVVSQGPLWTVATVELALEGPGPQPAEPENTRLGKPWSDWWRHDAETDLRRWYFKRGYADAYVALEAKAAPPENGRRQVTVMAHVRPGLEVRLSGVRFEGNTKTSSSVLRPLIKMKPGEPLDPIKVQDAEYRISRLGVFGSVDVKYDPTQGPERQADFMLKEGKSQEVDLLMGWGSYEELRAGVEWRDYDLWGLGHEGTLKLVQSLKSTEGEYDYSIPELFGTSTNLTDKVFGFRRLERAFVDEQFGNTLSATTPLPGIGSELSTGYTFERVHASSNTLATVLSEVANANATSFQATLTRDKRDNPLLPRQGYKVSLEVEEASRYLGGQVDFQQFQLSASYHTPWGRSRWIHLGFSHQVITTFAAPAGQELPPNVYFYPGGEDSIRGYNLGQAAPRDPATGSYLPAESVMLLNVELEQALTSKLSAVAFSDSLGATPTLTHYPFDYRLYTVGLGLRYQTIIGPIRLEYGRNLNPRPHDPSGTLQFSIGFPF